MSIDLAQGLTMTFGTSLWSVRVTEVGDVGWERAAVDSTYLGTTTAKEYLASRLVDGGSVTLTVQHNPASLPPRSTTAETITITLYDGNAISFSGFVTAYKLSLAGESVNTASCTLKVTGDVTGC